MTVRCAFVITAVFLGLIAYEEGTGSAMGYVLGGLLGLLWGTGLYLNFWWVANRIPRRTFRLPIWHWRIVVEPNPDPVSRRRPW